MPPTYLWIFRFAIVNAMAMTILDLLPNAPSDDGTPTTIGIGSWRTWRENSVAAGIERQKGVLTAVPPGTIVQEEIIASGVDTAMRKNPTLLVAMGREGFFAKRRQHCT